MAHTAHELNARRARILLRCQKIREERSRLGALRADHACTAAATEERSARDALQAHEAAASRRLIEAHEGVRGRVIDTTDLETLTAIEQDFAQETKVRAAALATAEATIQQARAVAAAAHAAVQAEARATVKRTRLADATAARWRRSLDAAQEVERDDQIADTWRSS